MRPAFHQAWRQDWLQRGAIETIIDDSPLVEMLPMVNVEGNAHRYTHESSGIATAP